MAEFAEYTKPKFRQIIPWLIATLSQNLTANLYSPLIRLGISQVSTRSFNDAKMMKDTS